MNPPSTLSLPPALPLRLRKHRLPSLRLFRVWEAGLPWALAGALLALALDALFAWAGQPVRAQAALLAVGGLLYVGAGVHAGSASLSLAGLLSLAGFASLAAVGMAESSVVLALGFWLQGAWSLMLTAALRGARRPGIPAGWIGLQLGMALAAVL